MLFRKKMPRSCSYCAFSAYLNQDQLLCSKRGIVSTDDKCFKFQYDPCKRVPVKAKALDFQKFDKEDFTL